MADAGYSNSEQAANCERNGLLPHVPANRSINNQGGGGLLDRTAFRYRPGSDTYLCPEGKELRRKQVMKKDKAILYSARTEDCGGCVLKPRCTQAAQRMVTRLIDEDALNRMHDRATPQVMKLRRSTVEHPFAALKYRIFGHPRLLLRGLNGARTEISLASMAYNLGRMINILGAQQLATKLQLA